MMDTGSSQFEVVLFVIAIVFLVASFVVVAVMIRRSTNNKESNEYKKEDKTWSYKQEKYYDFLRGDENSPYYGSNKISQTTYDAFSDYIYEFLGYEKGTDKNSEIIKIFIGNYDVLPDGHRDITWPRTTTYNLTHHYRFNMIKDDKIIVYFHASNNKLYKKLKLFFKERNVEIKYAPRIKPFSAKTNQYVVLNIYSEECTFLHYLLRIYYKERSMFGFAHYSVPEKSDFEDYKNRTIKKYHLNGEYEFYRYLLSFLFDKESVLRIMWLETPDIESIRDYIHKYPGFDDKIWNKCKAINKDLDKKLKGKS